VGGEKNEAVGLPPSRPICIIRKELDRKGRELKSAEKKLLGIKLELKQHQETIVRAIKREVQDLVDELYGTWAPKSRKRND